MLLHILLAKKIILFCRHQWRFVLGCIVPFLLSPLPIIAGTSESRCGYVILLMASYWMLEPIPLAATSLIPIVLFPLLGVLSTSDACTPYMNSTNMMFVGGLMMAVAIESCDLHKRIALNVLRRIQPTASWIMLGFMSTAMFLSMWISNTATAALMVPIIDAVLQEFEDEHKDDIQLKNISVISNPRSPTVVENGNADAKPQVTGKVTDASLPSIPMCQTVENNEQSNSPQKTSLLRKTMLLSVAYSTNIGGTGTITGTGPNLVLKGIVEELFPECDDLTFDKWMMYNVPVVLICVLVSWIYLQIVYLRKAAPKYSEEMKQRFRDVVSKKHEELGPMKFREKAVSFLFCVLVMLWIFRDPHFITGWGRYLPKKVGDATPAIAIPLLLFLIPAEPWRPHRSPPLIDWKTLQSKLPWGIIILLGGGFSLAEASKQSGLSVWASKQLASLNITSPIAVVGVLCLLTAVLTEFTSNVATANVLLPVVAQLAVATSVHPIYFLLPVTISTSFAFMLPVATPPNAIVFDAARMGSFDMVKPGLFMNIVCVGIETLMISTLGKAVFDFGHFPTWANITVTNSGT